MTGVLAVGGLATGIITITGRAMPLPTSTQVAALGIENGAAWAGPLLAIALLAVLGVAWWQARTCSDTPGDTENGEVPESSARLGRAWQLRRWAQVGLLLTSAGSVAGLAGTLISSDTAPGAGFGPPFEWSHDVLTGAYVLATLLVSAAGIWMGARVRDLVGGVEEDDAA